MLELGIASSAGPSCVLLLGAHCDDLEIGCGGSIIGMVKRWPATKFVWVTFSSDSERALETRAACARLLAGAKNVTIKIEAFRGSYFPYDGAALKDYFETLKAYQPELILTHYRKDLHQDHRIINELTWNAFRNHLIFEYEIPKFDGDLGAPNSFVALTREQLDRKIEILLECFPSQRKRNWFTRDTFEAIARLRGIECNAPTGFAEAFYGRKNRLNF
jgi:LmbE family N-acetylglucosaminyl deacetylase